MKLNPRYLLTMGLALGTYCAVAQSQITFSYDAAGNQVMRQYCPSPTACASSQRTAQEASPAEPEDSFTIYPNPTQGLLYLSWKETMGQKLQTVTLLDLSGRSVSIPFQQQGSSAQLQLAQWPSGLYFIQFGFEDNTKITKRISLQ